jgi:hypothetical protein
MLGLQLCLEHVEEIHSVIWGLKEQCSIVVSVSTATPRIENFQSRTREPPGLEAYRTIGNLHTLLCASPRSHDIIPNIVYISPLFLAHALA